ncbi:MAG: alpha/beta hydrolase [Marmoricola sp.]
MTTRFQQHAVHVQEGELPLFTFGERDDLEAAEPRRTVLAVHGITASSMSWPSVAAALPDGWRLVAPDLRGRGAARDLGTERAGLRRHAEDLCRAAERLDPEGTGDLVLAGHSMGAYVALLAAHARPDLFRRLVMVDGGVPLPLPAGMDPDEVLAASLGPALERLSRTYADVEEYVDFFRQHPALGPHWNDAVDAYVRYDALETPEGVRSRAVEGAVRADGRDLLVLGEELDAALRGLPIPAHLLCAPLGMFGQAPGLLPAAAVRAYDEELDHLTAETVPDVNHYTILFDPTAVARVAEVIADD